MYRRFLWGLKDFFGNPITLEAAESVVKRRLEERENNLLRLIGVGIFGYSRSPYLPLMKIAGCEFGDIRNAVHAKGIGKTLLELREAGVYIKFEEFKGREPIVREGKTFIVDEHDFDNPYLSSYYYVSSSGSTGAGTRIPVDLDHLAAQAPNLMLTYHAHRILDSPIAMWLGILPGNSGVNNILRLGRFGKYFQRWFTPITSEDMRTSLKYRLATHGIVMMGRLFGTPIPRPELLRLDQAETLARWASETLKHYGSCVVSGHPSLALRVCSAALENDLDLNGATFIMGGEPPTPTKVRIITSTGARHLPCYYLSESGILGVGCGEPKDENDIHFFKDMLALIQYPRKVRNTDIQVDAFNFTSLLSTAPKIMLNVEIDDYGIVENRSCGCPLDAYGFGEHVRNIYSFSKLTGEGMSIIGSEMIRILEEVLPDRFGGSPQDYQLMEEEGKDGFTRLNLLISPGVSITNHDDVIKSVLEELGKSSIAADFARALWKQANVLCIKRKEPIWTSGGKLMPLHMANLFNGYEDSER
jgi:hypothetical protein